MVEWRAAGEDALHDFGPLETLGIAVLDHRQAEQRELLRTPAADDIQAGAPARCMVHRRQRLRCEHWMYHRHMHGGEQRDALREASKCCGVSQRLKAPLAVVNLAAETLPARDRQEKLDAC